MDVRETFLDHPENRCFGIVGQTAKIGGHVEFVADLAGLGEALYIPAQRGLETRFVEQGTRARDESVTLHRISRRPLLWSCLGTAWWVAFLLIYLRAVRH